MPDRRRANCRECETHRDDCGGISWSGLCPACGELELTANVVGLHTKSGEPWARWRRAMAACVGAIIPGSVDEAA